jgi:protein involved in polysaccharide export with SLBB domain
MRFSSWRALSVAVLASVFVGAAPAAAQRPTAEQAQMLLRARPDLIEQLRKRVAESGLSPDQVRARLRAEGYPETLLDQYLPGATGTPDARLRDSATTALKSLGLVDSLDLMDGTGLVAAELDSATGARRDTLLRFLRDTLGLDSATIARRLRTPKDSLRYLRELFEARQEADSGLRIFGLDVFRTGAAQFQPNLAGPVDPSYRLGPGDRLVLLLTGDVERSYDLEVNREGFVFISDVGQVFVANLTLGQLEDVLYTRLGRSFSGVRRGAGATTRFSVSVSRLRTLQVFVVGDVERPGSYRISAAGTAFTALLAAGGPSVNGSLRGVQVKRAGKVVATLDGYAYLLKGDATNDVRLDNGDVVFVPPHGPRVRVTGRIVRPGTYETREGETVADAIALAGGFASAAERRKVTIERIVPPAQRQAPGRDRVVLTADGEQAAAALRTADGDVVRIGQVADRIANRVTVKGNVWNPGPIGLGSGLTVRDAIRAAGGLRPDTYLGRVLVTRMRPDSSKVQLRAAFTDTTGGVTEDFPLAPDDEIQVFSLNDFRSRRYVTIAGAVRKGGRFPYREGMTLRDLILLGGGLDQSASLVEAEIARLPESRANGATATTTRVPMDSSYLFERAPSGRYEGPPGLPAAASGGRDEVLRPYDNVLVFRQPDWELQRLVWITGEVKYPGRYALIQKVDRLADLVARAGGLTTEAYPEGVHFARSRDSIGRVAVNLPRALRNRDDADNIVLVDGDSIEVPRYTPVVSVKGFVNSPTAVALRGGADILFYVRSAGGSAKRGDVARAYVVQPNGLVETIRKWPWWVPLPANKPVPKGGATVIVPETDPSDALRTQQTFTQILSVVSILTPIFAVIIAQRI